MLIEKNKQLRYVSKAAFTLQASTLNSKFLWNQNFLHSQFLCVIYWVNCQRPEGSNIEGAVMPHVVSTLSVLATAIKQKKKCLVFAEVNIEANGGEYLMILKLLSNRSQTIN